MVRSAVVVALAVLACSKPPPPAAPPRNVAPPGDPRCAGAADRAVCEIEALRDAMCACTTAACAEARKHEWQALGQRYQDAQASEQVVAHVAAVNEQLLGCMLTLGVSISP